MSKKRDQTDFDGSLKALEELVQRMENGGLSLEESLKHFEQGIALTRQCQKSLEMAEQRIRILTAPGEQAETAPFEPDDPRQ